jgi:hypothetical protein
MPPRCATETVARRQQTAHVADSQRSFGTRCSKRALARIAKGGGLDLAASSIHPKRTSSAGMHPAARLQFESVVREFARWRAVPELERSPAPAWWWQPAFQVASRLEPMPALWCHRLEIPVGSTYAVGAEVLMAALADQTSLPWPEEFPRKFGNKGG